MYILFVPFTQTSGGSFFAFNWFQRHYELSENGDDNSYSAQLEVQVLVLVVYIILVPNMVI